MKNSPAALWEMVEKTKSLHERERRLTIESIHFIGELEEAKASVRLGFTIEEFCAELGLSPASYWKRLRVTKPKPRRTPIPNAVKYDVYRRDGGQCTYIGKSGQRCGARSMLEHDHIIMVCRGGDNTVQNLQLRCRYHNQAAAKIALT